MIVFNFISVSYYYLTFIFRDVGSWVGLIAMHLSSVRVNSLPVDRTNYNPHLTADSNADDILTFTFWVKLLDHVTLSNGHTFELMINVSYGNTDNSTTNSVTSNNTVTVEASDTDTATWNWVPLIAEKPDPLTRE